MDTTQSIWDKKGFEPYQKLENDIKCEVLVVGGGMAGILTAYKLTERGHDVVLLEAKRIAQGVTAHTTATITPQQGLIYGEILKKYGLETAKNYFDAQCLGIDLYKKIIDKHQIDCDFSILDGYQYAIGDTEDLQLEYEVLDKMGVKPQYVNTIDALPLKISGAIKQSRQAQFDPLKFLSGLPKKFKIFENTRVMDINLKLGIAYANGCKISADKIVVATNFPIVDFPGLIFFKQYQSSTYAIAYSGCGNVDGIYNDDKDDGFTIRNYGELLIVNGCDHRTGRFPDRDSFQRLDDYAKTMYPNCKEVCTWVFEDCVTYDHIPNVGRFKRSDNNSFVITGFNKWGMANSAVSASLIADLVEQKPNKFEKMYSPQRKYVRKNIFDFLKGAVVTVANLSKSYFTFPLKSVGNLEKGDGAVFMIKGKKCAVYKDSNDKLFVLSARCPHLGCQLEFNKVCKTWDCPCHGSRFNVDGSIIAAPTVDIARKIK